MRILLIKTSSLGDVIHNLPVATDIARQFPRARIDWVVEEGFADVPRLHPDVAEVIPVAIRRWRKALLARSTWRAIGAVSERLRSVRYDAVIDTQGLIKSAWLAHKANGVIHGMDAASAREPLAASLYQVRHAVARDQHAVTRNRQLAALALGYALNGPADYGLAAPGAVSPAPTSEGYPGGAREAAADPAPAPFVVLLTATSRDDKLWPEARWVALGHELHQRGLICRLPAGSPHERERAQRIAAQIPGACLEPPATIAQLADAMRPAQCVIGVDTGLVHLAAALGRPTIALYCASVPALTGVMADAGHDGLAINLGAAGAPPEVDQVILALDRLLDPGSTLPS